MRVITGTARGRRLREPEGMDIRPTTDKVKESIFNIVQFDVEGRRVLDLYFQIIIKIAEDLAPEISNIIRTTITNNRINLAVQHTSSPDWTKCDSAKVENIRRKIKAVMHIDDTADPALNRVIGLYVDYYISGMENMSNLRIGFPEIYEDLYRLEQSFKNEVSIRTLMNTDHLMNQSVFSTILSDFGEKLEKDFSTIFNQASIAEVKQDLIASWLADCSMEFRSM